ncbi:hypothetical protein KY336_03835 [Candidatus Woesearchaeota archaeon]|nr:hypothetical protein [Candidatus Woesearchaeota archaeon]
MDELTAQILKWAAIVFAAGFVGYFGRYLSMWIIDKMHKKKKKPVGKYEYKLEKRRMKAKKKKKKRK